MRIQTREDIDVLTSPPAPEMPKLPPVPGKKLMKAYDERKLSDYEKLKATIEASREAIAARMRQEGEEAKGLAAACGDGNVVAISRLMRTSLVRHILPNPLVLETDVALDASRVALCTNRGP